MSPLPVLIRILLCASLLLNGIGPAAASVRMAAGAPHAATGSATAPAASDCDHAVPGDAALPTPASHHADMTHGDDECLQSCMELCRHHCQAVFGLHASVAKPGSATEPVQRDVSGPRSMSAPPPIRPPIA